MYVCIVRCRPMGVLFAAQLPPPLAVGVDHGSLVSNGEDPVPPVLLLARATLPVSCAAVPRPLFALMARRMGFSISTISVEESTHLFRLPTTAAAHEFMFSLSLALPDGRATDCMVDATLRALSLTRCLLR